MLLLCSYYFTSSLFKARPPGLLWAALHHRGACWEWDGAAGSHHTCCSRAQLTRLPGDLHALSGLRSPGSHAFVQRGPVALQSVLWFCSLHSRSRSCRLMCLTALTSGPRPSQVCSLQQVSLGTGVSRVGWGPRKRPWLAAAGTSPGLLARSSLEHRAEG